jgi:hypothetical protein
VSHDLGLFREPVSLMTSDQSERHQRFQRKKLPDCRFMSLVGNFKFNYFAAQMTTHGAA